MGILIARNSPFVKGGVISVTGGCYGEFISITFFVKKSLLLSSLRGALY